MPAPPPRGQEDVVTVLLVSSGGGHLKELKELSLRLPFDEPYIWAVPRNALSTSLLSDQEVVWLKYNGSRDIPAVCTNAALMLRVLLRRRDISAVVTTGASHGIAAWPLSLARRVPMYYIETAARVGAPSASSRIAARLPGVRNFVQYPHQEDGSRTFAGSVFGSFKAESAPGDRPQPLTVLVTVGTMEDVGFRRMVELALAGIPQGSVVTWQTGPTDVADLPVEATPFIAGDQLADLVADADVVISHAGVGSILTALEAGRLPVVVPRYQRFGEHVDDHQVQIAAHLEELGLALVIWDDDRISSAVLEKAVRTRVVRASEDAQTLRLLAEPAASGR
jgi:UDP-N-acetylglucosamine--N-acetylmuramyl-(pentapeptide) pyrophosphoryl-undecaprenol N-acetylglucosamine transferase